jgi:hypothetical protein
MQTTRLPRPIVSSNQLRSLVHVGGFTVVVPVQNPGRIPTPTRKRMRTRRVLNPLRRDSE